MSALSLLKLGVMVVKRMLVTSTPATVSVVTFTSADGSMVARLSRFFSCRRRWLAASVSLTSRTMPTYGCSPSQPAATAPPPIQLNSSSSRPPSAASICWSWSSSPFAPPFPSCSRRRESCADAFAPTFGASAKKIASLGTKAASDRDVLAGAGSGRHARGAVHADRVVLEGERCDHDVRQRCQLLVQQVAQLGVGGAHLVAHRLPSATRR